MVNVDLLQSKNSGEEAEEGDAGARDGKTGSSSLIVGRIWGTSLGGTTDSASLGLGDRSLDIVGTGLAVVETLDDLVILELVEGIAREVARGLGVEGTLDIFELLKVNTAKC